MYRQYNNTIKSEDKQEFLSKKLKSGEIKR